MSLEALSEVVRISRSHLARIEVAEALPPPSLPPALDAAFGTNGFFAELYLVASKEVHPDQFQRRMSLEAQARLIEEYVPQVVSGLVQTEEYARAQFAKSNPKATHEQVEELVAARLGRQSVLEGDAPADLSLILDEAALRRSFGGPQVMRAQLAKLEELSLTPTTLIQVLPFDEGGHALLGGTLSLLTLSDGARVAYEEASTTGTLLEDIESVAVRQRAYDLLRACALSPKKSAAFIRQVMEDLGT